MKQLLIAVSLILLFPAASFAGTCTVYLNVSGNNDSIQADVSQSRPHLNSCLDRATRLAESAGYELFSSPLRAQRFSINAHGVVNFNGQLYSVNGSGNCSYVESISRMIVFNGITQVVIYDTAPNCSMARLNATRINLNFGW